MQAFAKRDLHPVTVRFEWEGCVQVRNGSGDTSPKCRLFRGLPKGFKVYPCLSMCNAGQVVFLKYGEH
jgi:hypothetical protein